MDDLSSIPWPGALDLIIGTTIALSLGLGVVRGLLREVFSLIAWVAAFWVAYLYGSTVAQRIDPVLQNPPLSEAAGAVLTFSVVLICLLLLASLIRRIFHATGLTGMDRAFGALFGAVRALVVITALLGLARSTAALEQDWYNASLLVPYFDPVVDLVSRKLTQPLMETIGAQALDSGVLGVGGATD
jgi:membrane protein required for colicin V production